MARSKRPGITTGSGVTEPILAGENEPMEGLSQPSPTSTSIGEGSTKPLSVKEALSLLQTLCSDLRSLKCETAILARKNRLYIIAQIPASNGRVETEDGHILLDNRPVSY